MYRGGQEALLPHVPDSEHAGIAEAMIDFGLREGAFNGFFSPTVNATADTGLGKGNDIIQSILPNMSFHHPSGHALSEALCPSGTSCANLGVAEVLTVAFPGGGFPVEMLVFRTDVNVEEGVVPETIFAVVFAFVGMPPIANGSLYTLGLQKMSGPRVVVGHIFSTRFASAKKICSGVSKIADFRHVDMEG